MGWATHYIEKLRAGETVSFRPRDDQAMTRNTCDVSNDASTNEMSEYDELAVNYHWLYSDYVCSGKLALAGAR